MSGGYISGPGGPVLGSISEGEYAVDSKGLFYRATRNGDRLVWVLIMDQKPTEDYAFLLANVRDAVGEDE